MQLCVLLLLLLSRFSRVRLCATPETAAYQAPPSLGFSRQEHWSGLPFPSPMHERKSESEVAHSCLTLSDPMDCSLPGFSVHGFSRQEYWSGVLLPSLHTLKGICRLNIYKTCEVLQSRVWTFVVYLVAFLLIFGFCLIYLEHNTLWETE